MRFRVPGSRLSSGFQVPGWVPGSRCRVGFQVGIQNPDATKMAESWRWAKKDGAGGGNRTHKAVRPLDFEPSASASSATPARLIEYTAHARPALRLRSYTRADDVAARPSILPDRRTGRFRRGSGSPARRR